MDVLQQDSELGTNHNNSGERMYLPDGMMSAFQLCVFETTSCDYALLCDPYTLHQ